MTRSNEYDDNHALAGEYVLGTLPLVERQAFEKRLAAEPELQQAVIDWEERFFSVYGAGGAGDTLRLPVAAY